MQKPTGGNEQSFLCEPNLSVILCVQYHSPSFCSQSPLSTLPFAVGSEAAAEGHAGPPLQARAVVPSGQVLRGPKQESCFMQRKCLMLHYRTRFMGQATLVKGAQVHRHHDKNTNSNVLYELHFFLMQQEIKGIAAQGIFTFMNQLCDLRLLLP